MAGSKFDTGPMEPAHPKVIEFRNDLVGIYSLIRKKYQVAIDKAFDDASKKIGFVVASTIPFVFDVGKDGTIKKISIGAEELKDTVFDAELSETLSSMLKVKFPVKTPGSYNLYLLWFEALKLKLRTEWLEPVHYLRRGLEATLTQQRSFDPVQFPGGGPWLEPAHYPRPWLEPAHPPRSWLEPAHYPRPWLEPAHPGIRELLPDWKKIWEKEIPVRPKDGDPPQWFDPGIIIAAEEKLLISAIDEVYPELKLVDSITMVRQQARQFWPGIKEPAHYRDFERYFKPVATQPEKRDVAAEVLTEIANILKKFNF